MCPQECAQSVPACTMRILRADHTISNHKRDHARVQVRYRTRVSVSVLTPGIGPLLSHASPGSKKTSAGKAHPSLLLRREVCANASGASALCVRRLTSRVYPAEIAKDRFPGARRTGTPAIPDPSAIAGLSRNCKGCVGPFGLDAYKGNIRQSRSTWQVSG